MKLNQIKIIFKNLIQNQYLHLLRMIKFNQIQIIAKKIIQIQIIVKKIIQIQIIIKKYIQFQTIAKEILLKRK